MGVLALSPLSVCGGFIEILYVKSPFYEGQRTWGAVSLNSGEMALFCPPPWEPWCFQVSGLGSHTGRVAVASGARFVRD